MAGEARTKLVLTMWEPRRRWWGGMRADVTLERYQFGDSSETWAIVSELAQATWRVPDGWKYRKVELEA